MREYWTCQNGKVLSIDNDMEHTHVINCLLMLSHHHSCKEFLIQYNIKILSDKACRFLLKQCVDKIDEQWDEQALNKQNLLTAITFFGFDEC